MTIAQLASASGVSADTIARGLSANEMPWKGSTAEDVVRGLEQVAPLTAREREQAIAVGLVLDSKTTDPIADMTFPSPGVNPKFDNLVERMGPRRARLCWALIDAVTDIVMSHIDEEAIGGTDVASSSSETPPRKKRPLLDADQHDLPPPPLGGVRSRTADGLTIYEPATPAEASARRSRRVRRA